MTDTTTELFSIDGVTLNNLAYNISTKTGRYKMPGVHTPNVHVAGRSGSIWTPFKKFEEGSVVLSMWVRGVDVNGAVTTTDKLHFHSNKEKLQELFSKRHGLLDVRQVQPDGTTRRCWAEVIQAIDLTMFPGVKRAGNFVVELNLPYAFWEDLNTVTQDSAVGATLPKAFDMTTFAAATAPMEDLVYEVHGPITNPKVINPDTGIWFRYGAAIANGVFLTVDSGLWTIDLSTGVENWSLFTHAGHSRFMYLPPNSTLGSLAPNLSLEGTGGGANTKLKVTGRRKYLT